MHYTGSAHLLWRHSRRSVSPGRDREEWRFLTSLLMVGALSLVAGCSQPKPEGDRQTAEKAGEAVPGDQASKSAADARLEANQDGEPTTGEPETVQVTTDESGRRWLTPEVPYDVYSGLPSAEELIAANDSEQAGAAGGPVLIGGSAAGGQGTAAPEKGSMGEGTDSDSGSMESEPAALASADPPTTLPESSPEAESELKIPENPAEAGWEMILPIPVLDDEISVVRNRLEQNVLTVGSFNAALEQIARDGWLISALSTIAAKHPGSFSWKEHALLARKAAVNLAQAASAGGRKNFREAELAVAQVSAVLNNNAPAGLGEPKKDASIPKTADRAALMQRIKKARNRLRTLASDSGMFQQHLTEVEREARVMAALAKFVLAPDYSGAKQADYQEAAGQVIAAGLTMSGAAEEKDFATFQSALRGVSTACASCHQKYR